MKKQIEKPYNGGKWTEARMRSFAMSAIRRAQWPAKYASLDKIRIGPGINPKTGHKCILHKCPSCNEVGAKGDFHADHINPIIPLDHKWENCFLGYDWNEVLRNLWCEVDGFHPLCKDCHKAKSKQENIERKNKRDKLTTTSRMETKQKR